MLLRLRIPRPTEGQALFMFTNPNGSFMRLCHEFAPVLTCALYLEPASAGHYSK